jgi:WD40 repeat protein
MFVKGLVGHTEAVRCVAYCADRLVSGSEDNNIRIWNTSTWTCEHNLLP